MQLLLRVIRSPFLFLFDNYYDYELAQKETRKYRKRTPNQHAAFLQYAAITLDFVFPQTETQAAFDHFYETTLSLLDRFYPERSITITSRDPDYVTPELKAKLRRKHKLMRAGRVEEANGLAKQIGKDITGLNKTRLASIQGKTDARDMWSAVRSLTGRKTQTPYVAGLTADTLDSHYSHVSTDAD